VIILYIYIYIYELWIIPNHMTCEIIYNKYDNYGSQLFNDSTYIVWSYDLSIII